MTHRPFVFVSYARHDREPVRRVVEELKKLGIETWVDADQLVPGDSWQNSIAEALRGATAILVFITPRSVASQYAVHELGFAQKHGVRLLPVLLEATPVDSLPVNLRTIQWLDATRFSPKSAAAETAFEIAKILKHWTAPANDTLQEADREELARVFSVQVSGAPQEAPSVAASPRPDSVFIVHGHDESLLAEVVDFLNLLQIRPIVLRDVGGASMSLFQKFFEIGGAAKFAIVLLSADDFGASLKQYDNPPPHGGVHALKFRSRQNVVLELGYFYGLLGWDKVFVLEKAPSREVPDYERPSDLNGVLFDRLDDKGRWKGIIRQKLATSGFQIPA